LSAQIEAFRAILRSARDRVLTPGEHAAIVELTGAVVTLLDERDGRDV
jgi:hypothetical protein